MQVGNGGTTGSLGFGPITDNGVLVFNRSDSVAYNNAISGGGNLVQQSSGTLTLTGANTLSGATIVSNGTLVVTSVGGEMDVSGGTLVAGGVGSVITLNIGGALNIFSGTVVAGLDKTQSPSNTVYSAAGLITYAGGKLKLLNYGPSLVVGDTFNIFNQLVNGPVMPIVSPGFTVTNNLAVDGSVSVASVAAPGTAKITASLSSGQLNLSWPAIWKGLNLQVQTNSLAVGVSTNWVTIPGTDASNNYSTTPNNSNRCVFYRLVQ